MKEGEQGGMMLWKSRLTFKWLSDYEISARADLRASSRARVTRCHVGREKMKDSLCILAPRITIIPDLLVVSNGQQNFSEALTSSETDARHRKCALRVAPSSSDKSL